MVRHWGSRKFEEKVITSGCSIEEFAKLYIWLHRFEFSGDVIPDGYYETHFKPALGDNEKLCTLARLYMVEGGLGISYPSTMKAEGRVVTPGHSPRGRGEATGKLAPRGLNF